MSQAKRADSQLLADELPATKRSKTTIESTSSTPSFEKYAKDLQGTVESVLSSKSSQASKFFSCLKGFLERYNAELFPILYGMPECFTIVSKALLPRNDADAIRKRNKVAQTRAAKLSKMLKEWKEPVLKDEQTSGSQKFLFEKLLKESELAILLANITRVHPERQVRYLSLEHIDLANTSIPLDQLLPQLAAMLRSRQLSFPWKNLYISNDNSRDMMKNLRSHTAAWSGEPCKPHNIRFVTRDEHGNLLFPLNYEGGYLGLAHPEADYRKMDVFMDVYQEQARLSAKRQDQDFSPLDQWERPGFIEDLLQQAWDKYGKLTPFTMREQFYTMVRECTQFKPSLAVAIIRRFKATRMLDISAGWGDRLTGAIAAGLEKYQAFDPNTSLQAGHSQVIKQFVPPDQQHRFKITYTGFEHAKLDDNDYDLVFTSPPFFDFEVYTSIPGQSVDTYKSLDTWLVRFLFVSLRRAWAALRPEGHMVIHITDVFKTQVCEKMCLLLQWQLTDFTYLGVICSFGGAGRGRPLWVFRKTTIADQQSRAMMAEKELRRISLSTFNEATKLFEEESQT
eukprot:m.50242 g.50242  ORF g.50242 m.50242 type:complete len:566 (+) comp13405_c0_seq3:71-1768(+)